MKQHINNGGQDVAPQIVVVNKSNGAGTAGFVISLIALLCSWAPILNWILWLIGLLLSFIGLFKKPRGLAIAGTIVSFIGVIVLIVFAGALTALMKS